MNEVIKNMLTRVSVRKFTAERVEDEKLKTIVECAKASPTGKNRQMRKFTVVHNREKIQELARAVSSVLDIPNYRIYDCDALILISFEEDDRFGYCDSFGCNSKHLSCGSCSGFGLCLDKSVEGKMQFA